MEWIKCSDRPAPTDKKFLAYNKENDMAIVWSTSGNYTVRGQWYGSCEYGCGGDDYFNDITHWMPLPEMPNG